MRDLLHPEQVASGVLADYLFDPASAQFRSLARGKGDAICGKVNAKNRYGAYVGFKDFVIPADHKTVYVSDYNDRLESARYGSFVSAFLASCATKAEQDSHEREISSRYSEFPTPDLDTTNLTVDADASEPNDPFAD